MELPSGPIGEIDPDFERTALAVGTAMWSIEGLSMREKALLCIASNVCGPSLGISFALHVRMAKANGVDREAIRETVRHLAPYCGYPSALEALAALARIPDPAGSQEKQPADQSAVHIDCEAVLAPLASLGGPLGRALIASWSRPQLTLPERALIALAADVSFGTLDASFATHVEIAHAAGIDAVKLDATLDFVTEFGVARARAAREALRHMRERS